VQKKKLAICIPTYNRANCLRNCLESISCNEDIFINQVDICISNNGSSDFTEEVIDEYKEKLPIIRSSNNKNIGIPRNFLKVVSMANSEFIWLIGDDDLLLPDSLKKSLELINLNKDVDFFYVNSFHLSTDYVDSHNQPFNTINLPNNMERFSKYNKEGKLKFLDLIKPKISFDFLGGMFLSIFRKDNWDKHAHMLDQRAIYDDQTFSHFDNTFPHLKIFSYAFSNSLAYFNPVPLNVCLTGAREWSPMEPLVRNVRLIEALELYKKNGLSTFQYHLCRNFALSNFIPGLGYMIFNKDISGYKYINPIKVIISNCLYPMFYLSFFSFIIRKIKDKLIYKSNLS
tara:strand:+ start:561 stop:1589 length:1029 start_codon:yes stop_codon:yes gene_type:complete